ncbi:PT117 protein, partial [Polypterus senegalus]
MKYYWYSKKSGLHSFQSPFQFHQSSASALAHPRLHEGVIRDLERQAQKKANLLQLEEQIALTKELKREQKRLAESENC